MTTLPDYYRNNHYVPQWYQKKFLLLGSSRFYYLNLNPQKYLDSKGISHTENAIKWQGSKKSFCEKDLYTRRFETIASTEIEKTFFGNIDTKGRDAVAYFEKYNYPPEDWKDHFESIMIYMSMQKLRTPKGLDWLKNKSGTSDNNKVLQRMVQLRGIHCAIWTECVWLIADASNSDTKFIISDHPVTVYNRKCAPWSDFCRESNDPDILLQATHTIFPLSIDKILILTNLSWVRNPYQSETKLRPNPNLYRSAIFKFTDIQVQRYLTEQEVCEINYIIKKRAYKYIAAAKEEWLYPEKKIPNQKWDSFGNGYLLMPDPRPVTIGGEIMWGGGSGGYGSMDEYGRIPGDPDYNKETNAGSEWNTLHWFQAEFAKMVGPFRRGRNSEAGRINPENDSDDFHQYHLNLKKKNYKERHKKITIEDTKIKPNYE